MATKKTAHSTIIVTIEVVADTSKVVDWKGKQYYQNEVKSVEVDGEIPGFDLTFTRAASACIKEGGHLFKLEKKESAPKPTARKRNSAKAQTTIDQGTSASAKNLPPEMVALLPTLTPDAQIALIKAFGQN